MTDQTPDPWQDVIQRDLPDLGLDYYDADAVDVARAHDVQRLQWMTKRAENAEDDATHQRIMRDNEHLAGIATLDALQQAQQEIADLKAAATAVLAQWDAPNWKLAEPTAALMAKLRAALTPEVHHD